MTVPVAFRLFGSKVRVASQIVSLIPPGMRSWIEAFAGTASVTLAKPRHFAEHVNDINSNVTNLYRLLRDEAQRERLCQAIALTPWSLEEYTHALARLELEADPVEKARLFLVRSWQAFGGKQSKTSGWRAVDGGNGLGITPWVHLPTRLKLVAERFRGVCIHNRPAIEMLDIWGDRPDTVIFVDPPYPLSAINAHGSMYDHGMLDDQAHADLAEALLRARANVILTMARGTLYEDVLRGWTKLPLPVRGQHNQVREEVVLLNYEPPFFSMIGDVSHETVRPPAAALDLDLDQAPSD